MLILFIWLGQIGFKAMPVVHGNKRQKKYQQCRIAEDAVRVWGKLEQEVSLLMQILGTKSLMWVWA